MLSPIISQTQGCPSVRILISERTIELISLFISCNFCILHEVKIGSGFEKQHQIGHDCVKPSSNLLLISLQMRHTRVNTEVYREIPCSHNYAYRTFLFPGLFLYVYIESPNSIKPRKPHIPSPKSPQLKTPTQKTQSKTQTPKPQTTINEQK